MVGSLVLGIIAYIDFPLSINRRHVVFLSQFQFRCLLYYQKKTKRFYVTLEFYYFVCYFPLVALMAAYPGISDNTAPLPKRGVVNDWDW